ncbi:MAG: DUF4296 domain-containing protein [Prevotella sp.]|nr:DUF4296 domain-containing protein [Prevotella sp.]
MSRCRTIVGLLLVLVLVSCQPGTPSQYIQPDDMEDILVDYHLARAMSDQEMNQNGGGNYVCGLYLESVLRKHGVTQAEFDSSLIYYYTRADRFDDIYKRVAERLEEKALVMGASEGDIGKYASLDASGDTANIWSDRPQLMLLTMPPYNRRNIEVAVDSTFAQGDSFLFQFMSEFMFQDGMRTAIGYLALQYTDTLMTRTVRISTSGLNQLRIPGHDAELQSIRGYFFCGEGSERTTTTRLLFLSNIQFIRFHKKQVNNENEHKETPKDSLSSDSVAGRNAADTLSPGNPGLGGRQMLSLDTGVTIHRMVNRPCAVRE